MFLFSGFLLNERKVKWEDLCHVTPHHYLTTTPHFFYFCTTTKKKQPRFPQASQSIMSFLCITLYCLQVIGLSYLNSLSQIPAGTISKTINQTDKKINKINLLLIETVAEQYRFQSSAKRCHEHKKARIKVQLAM